MSHYQGTTLNTFLLDHQSSLLQSRYKITLLLLFTRKFHCDFLCWQQQNILSFFFSHNIIIRCSCTRRCCEDCQSASLQIIKPALLAPHHKEHFTGETLILMPQQCAKTVVSDSRGGGGGLVDFAIGLVNSVLKWSIFLRNATHRRTMKSILLLRKCWGLVEMTFELVNASFSLLEWQAVKMTFFASCSMTEIPYWWSKTVFP